RAGLGVTEFGFRLPLELWFAEFDGDDGGESFADVVTGEVLILLPQDAAFASVPVDERGQRAAESLFVGAALGGVDRVRVGVHALGVGTRPLHRDLEGDLF